MLSNAIERRSPKPLLDNAPRSARSLSETISELLQRSDSHKRWWHGSSLPAARVSMRLGPILLVALLTACADTQHRSRWVEYHLEGPPRWATTWTFQFDSRTLSRRGDTTIAWIRIADDDSTFRMSQLSVDCRSSAWRTVRLPETVDITGLPIALGDHPSLINLIRTTDSLLFARAVWTTARPDSPEERHIEALCDALSGRRRRLATLRAPHRIDVTEKIVTPTTVSEEPIDFEALAAEASLMKSGLKDIVVAQELYFADHHTFTDVVSELQILLRPRWKLSIVKAHSNGWSARLTSGSFGIVCALFVGDATTFHEAPASEEAVPECTLMRLHR